MPKLDAKRSHSLPLDEAKSKVLDIVEDVKKQYGQLVGSVEWNDEKTAAKVVGKMFKGNFEVTANEVKIHLDLSFMAKPFMGKIESRINSKLDEHFG